MIPAASNAVRSAPTRRTQSPGIVRAIREFCLPALRRMYLPESKTFAFRVRRTTGGAVVEGTSDRYTAIVLIGLSRCTADERTAVIGRETIRGLAEQLKGRVLGRSNLGDLALSVWASLANDDDDVEEAIGRLRGLYETEAATATVELAWALAALSQPGTPPSATALRDRLAGVLLDSCEPSGLWPHSVGRAASRLRGHVGCFADQVYPIQALSLFAARTNCDVSRSAAESGAQALCATQGAAGQWWWHYDVRTGDVVEGYPVYAVHQHAMGPMALRDLHEAGGACFSEAIERGLEWLRASPELGGGSLIDPAAQLVWRKVARREPRKLVRRLQAMACAVHPNLRAPGTGVLFPPRAIDFESRPYEYGWMLYAWKGPER